MKSRSEYFFQFSIGMTFIFAALIIWSFFSGTQIVNTKIPESVFTEDEVEEAPIEFVLEKGGPLTMTVSGPTLNNSWLWVKTVVLDSQDIALVEHDFDLSYYYGSDWSEGNQSASWTFRLPAGSYKVLVFGENERSSLNLEANGMSRDLLEVEIQSGIVLMRYFVLGFLIFLVLSFVAHTRRDRDLAESQASANRHDLFS